MTENNANVIEPVEFSLETEVPAVFTHDQAGYMTERYHQVPTDSIIEVFQDNGWTPKGGNQVQSRVAHRKNIGKHLIQLRNSDLPLVNDSALEIILINSHDGTTPLTMMAGMFRFACANGLIVSDADFMTMKFRHSKTIHERVENGIKELVDVVPQIAAKAEKMQKRKMTKKGIIKFGEEALKRIYSNSKSLPLYGEEVTIARRSDDSDRNLWNAYNVVQENIIKGGLTGRTAHGHNRTMAPVKNIDRNVRINRVLWDLANETLVA